MEEKSSSAVSVDQITVGKDLLELLSSGMYLDPLTIFREYVQNSCDSIEEAVKKGALNSNDEGRVSISINPIDRTVTIKDNGIGIGSISFLKTLLSFGNSGKKETDARGFRGIGRLAGLAYCQELVFHSKTKEEDTVNVLTWDCRKLKSLLVDPKIKSGLADIVSQATKSEKFKATSETDKHFFKVEMKKILRIKNDVLLNASLIEQYLSQVAPVHFSDDFKFKEQIRSHLNKYCNLQEHNIFIGENKVLRRFRNHFEFSTKVTDYFTEFEEIKVVDNDENLLAVGFLLHHSYYGAINRTADIAGLRARSGNIQIGTNVLFLDLYPEQRFNAWTIGEIHVLSDKLVPNGRRDDFEKSNQYYNFLNYVSLITKRVSDICRQKSLQRNQEKVFDFSKIKSQRKDESAKNIIKEVKKSIKDEKKLTLIKTVIYDELSKY